MPDQRQKLLTPDPAGIRLLGNRSDVNLRASFPHSPLPGYRDEVYSDQERANFHQAKVLDGYRPIGHGVNNFHLDFKGDGTTKGSVPDTAGNDGVETEAGQFGAGGGAPTTQYIPPLTSPGPGSISATDQPAYTGITKDPASNIEFGSGLSGLTSPHATSEEIAKQSLLSDYISGRSYALSAG